MIDPSTPAGTVLIVVYPIDTLERILEVVRQEYHATARDIIQDLPFHPEIAEGTVHTLVSIMRCRSHRSGYAAKIVGFDAAFALEAFSVAEESL